MGAYEKLLQEPEATVPLRTSSLLTLAQLNLVKENWDKGIALILQWMDEVENVTAQSRMNENRDHREIKSFRDQLGIAINLVVTRLALLVAGWWLGHRAFGAAWGPVVGIICMTIGLFAEIGIYMIKARRLDATLLQRDEREKLSFPGASLAQSQLYSTQTREQILDAR